VLVGKGSLSSFDHFAKKNPKQRNRLGSLSKRATARWRQRTIPSLVYRAVSPRAFSASPFSVDGVIGRRACG